MFKKRKFRLIRIAFGATLRPYLKQWPIEFWSQVTTRKIFRESVRDAQRTATTIPWTFFSRRIRNQLHARDARPAGQQVPPRRVAASANRSKASEAFAEATEIYQRAIDLDNLSEDIYQRLIFCLKKLGKDAEALNAFRRCRDMLSIVLGVTPSRETRALVHLDN